MRAGARLGMISVLSWSTVNMRPFKYAGRDRLRSGHYLFGVDQPARRLEGLCLVRVPTTLPADCRQPVARVAVSAAGAQRVAVLWDRGRTTVSVAKPEREPRKSGERCGSDGLIERRSLLTPAGMAELRPPTS